MALEHEGSQNVAEHTLVEVSVSSLSPDLTLSVLLSGEGGW